VVQSVAARRRRALAAAAAFEARAVGRDVARLAGAAPRARSTAAIDVGLGAALHLVGAATSDAQTIGANGADAVEAGQTGPPIGALHALAAAAVDVALVAVLDLVVARGARALARSARARRAVSRLYAPFAVAAG